MSDLSLFANQALFGSDPLERVVAVHYLPPNKISHSIREKNGELRIETRDYRPFAWSGEKIGEGGTLLAGDAFFQYLIRFENAVSLQTSRKNFKDSLYALPEIYQQFLVASGITLFKNLRFAELHRLQIHLECNNDKKINTLLLSDNSGWQETRTASSESEEKELINELSRIIEERDPDIIEGHQFFKTALPLLVSRAKKLKCKLLWGRDGSPLRTRSTRIQIAEKNLQYTRPEAVGRHFVDTYILALLHDVSARELESFELASLHAHFSPKNKNSHPALQIRDLAEALSESYFLQTRIFPMSYQDVILRGNATRINTLFLREYYRAEHSLPLPPEAEHFAGGYTDIFETGLFKNVWHCDIASLYPSLILSKKLFPESDDLKIFATLLSDLRKFRLETKAAVRSEKNPQRRQELDSLQTTFKILINSFYGYLGFSQGNFADFSIAAKITQHGRELLQQMVDWLQKSQAKVIEIDTDGIYFVPPPNRAPDELQSELQKSLPKGIDVELDHIYAAMFSYKAKNYALLNEDDSIILRGGALKSRALEPYLRDYLKDLMGHLIRDQGAKAKRLADEYATAIQSRKWPIEYLAKTDNLQDSVSAYQSKIEAGTRNRAAGFEVALRNNINAKAGDSITYYITGDTKKVTAYENARHIDEWNSEQRDENTTYYIGKLKDLEKKFSDFFDTDAQEL
ncbi:MAG: DNA polymerase domain-containing protein, partial [Chthoniobacterales bacterium]